MIVSRIEWRTKSKGLWLWTAIFSLLIFLFAAIYPQMFTANMQATMNQMLENLPAGLLQAFNIEVTGPASMLTPSGYFAYYFQYLFLAACIYALLLGGNALIKEEADGTLDFLYSQPVTRKGIVTSKLIANILILLVFWVLSALSSVVALALFKGTETNGAPLFWQIWKIYAADFLVLLFFLSLGFCISARLSTSKQVTGIGLGIVFGFYLAGILAELTDQLAWLKNFSPVALGNPATLLEHGLKHGLPLVAACVGLVLMTYLIYQRRDFRIS